MNVSGVLSYFVDKECYDELFIKWNFQSVVCLRLVGVKLLGYMLIAMSVFVKVPQILKMIRAASSEGLNFFSELLNMISSTTSAAYSFASGYPVSAYGDTALLMMQNIAIALLVLTFRARWSAAILLLVAVAAMLIYVSSSYVYLPLLRNAVRLNTLNVFVGKHLQAWTNYRQGHTGQMAAATVFMLTFRVVARFLTTLVETGDTTLLTFYGVTIWSNFLLAFQMLYYWNAKPKKE